MKNKLLFGAAVVAIAATFTLSSCSKITDAISKTISGQPIDVSITISPQSNTTAQGILGTATVAYNLDSIIKASTDNVLSSNNISSVKLTSCVLTITSGADVSNNFANFQSASFYFGSSATNSAVAASISNNPDTSSTVLTIPVNPDQELKSYISGGTFFYQLSGQLRRATTATLTVNVHIEMSVQVHG